MGGAALFVLEKFLSAAAKSALTCVISESEIPDAARPYFEKYGNLYYRAMNEDCGGNVWAPASLIPELDKIYGAFDLIRHVIPSDFTPAAGHSLIDVSFTHDWQCAVMRPLMIYSDFSELLRAHTERLSASGCDTVKILFNLGSRSEGSPAAAAAECGYVPEWIRPGECIDDTLVMKYDE